MVAPGLSPQLSRQLQSTLLSCGPFSSAEELQVVFSDARISPWRHLLPEANSAVGRVDATIDFLHRRENGSGENGLVLLLRVLGERTPPEDRCYRQLLELADAVEEEKKERVRESDTLPESRANASDVKIPLELQERVGAGEVALFVGHRLSEAAGVPSRRDLAGALAGRMAEALPGALYGDGERLPEIAQLYEVAHGRHALLRYFRDQLDTTVRQPAAVHHALARLPVHTIFTTTYDDLLERALRQAGRRVNRVTGDAMLPHTSANRVQLVKLKGDIEMPDTVVITRSDLDHYLTKHPLIVNQLRDRLSSTTFLLVGYDVDDPDLDLLFGQSGYQTDGGRLHYALMTELSALQEQMLRHRQIRALAVEPDSRARWLEALANRTGA